jgi:hypothetical protein
VAACAEQFNSCSADLPCCSPFTCAAVSPTGEGTCFGE